MQEVVRPTLIAGGEHEFTHYGFAEIVRAKALDLWQPDITWCGGLTAGLRIVDLANTEGIPVSPHRGGEVWGLHMIVASNCEDLANTIRTTYEPTEISSGWMNLSRAMVISPPPIGLDLE